MSKLFLKCVSITTAMGIMFSLVACGGEAKQAEGTPKPTVSSSQDAPKVKEPVTLKVYGPVFGGSYPNGIQSDPVAKEIERVTGVTLDIENDDNRLEKLPALLASGDIPDIIGLQEMKYIKPLVEGKLITELDELVNTNGKDILDGNSQKVEFSKKYLSQNTNKLYFIPGSDDKDSIDSPVWAPADTNFTVRWDLYKKIGYPEANNVFDTLDILKKMQDLEPTNAEGKKVYALSPWLADWELYNVEEPFAVINGVRPTYNGMLEINPETGETKSFAIDPAGAMWTGIKYYYKANQMKILDPDSFTQKWDQFGQKMTSNRVIATFAGWAMNSGANTFKEAGQPEKGYMQMSPLKSITTVAAGSKAPLGNTSRLWAIGASCETPDRAMDVLNYFNSYEGCVTLYTGVKDVDWEIKDEKVALTQAHIEGNSTPDYSAKSGAGKYWNMIGRGSNVKWPQYNVPMNLNNLPQLSEAEFKPETPLKGDYVTHYNIKFPADLNKNIKFVYLNDAVNALLPEAPSDIKTLDAKVKQYLMQESVKLILSKNDQALEDGIKKAIETVKAMGYQKSVDYWQASYKQAFEAVKSIQ